MWRRRDAGAAIDALAASGCTVLGLDLRRYEADGRFLELPWAAFETTGETVAAGRRLALEALRGAEECHDVDDFEWVLVTWQAA